MKAMWNGKVIAESNETIIVEGNHYFPTTSLLQEYISNSKTTTECHWKGTAHYYNVLDGELENSDAAWYYPSPKDAAKEIKNYVAFWKGVVVS